MNTYESILKRRSVRKFKDDKVTDDIVNKLLISAMAAPSAKNKQPWEFYVITNKDVMKKLRGVAKSIDFESPLMIIVAGNKCRSISVNDNDFWIQDCSAAVENILLAATELELGSLWCGLYPIAERVEMVRKIINLDENIVPMALVHVGYAAEEKESRSQYNLEYIHYLN